MKQHSLIKSVIVLLVLTFAVPATTLAASPATVNLGTAANYVILSKTGVSATGATSIVGDIGVSPVAASYITGFSLSLPSAGAFSTSPIVTGKVYAPDYANPTSANLTTAILDMQTAYTDAMGRAPDVTELGAGNIGGLTIAPGTYKWGTGVLVPTDVTLSGGANDIWIFQIAQTLTVSTGAKIILSGGAQASNIFWVVSGQTTLETNSVFHGNIIDQTAIVLKTGASINGRMLAQTAVTLDANAVTLATASSVSPAPTTPPATVTPLPAATVTPSPTTSSPSTTGGSTSGSVTTTQTSSPGVSTDAQKAALETRLSGLKTAVQMLITQRAQQGASGVSSSAFGQQVRTIATNLRQGSRGEQVATLQQFLIAQNAGNGSAALAQAGATAYFGPLTRSALAEYQAKVGISPALGNFGPITRAYLETQVK